ncbi:MAG: class I SAM-dependent methyltransferase [Acidimicrobiia bacterium]
MSVTNPGDADYGAWYYQHGCGIPYERNEHWLGFFRGIAEQIVSLFHPSSVLDAGCAFGMLVEALRDLGVDAYGVDISEYAISQAREDIRPYLRQGSLADPFDRRYDLVISIEVLEHLSAGDIPQAIKNIANATDTVVFSSTPDDYKEATHISIRPPEQWSADFARHGLLRDPDVEIGFITPWAGVYRRESHLDAAAVVHSYERALWRLRNEASQLRSALIETQRHLNEAEAAGAAVAAGDDDELLRVRGELLDVQDQLVGAEAALGEALARARVLETERDRYARAAEELDELRRSRVWRATFKAMAPYRKVRTFLGG